MEKIFNTQIKIIHFLFTQSNNSIYICQKSNVMSDNHKYGEPVKNLTLSVPVSLHAEVKAFAREKKVALEAKHLKRLKNATP